MAFEAFIKRTTNGKDIDFEHNFEREPVIQIARAMHNRLSLSPRYYALLANVDIPSRGKGNTRQIDAILVSEDGMAVIDFKSASQPFVPSLDDRPWHYTNGRAMKAGANKNPFRQMERQREALYQFMQRLPDNVDRNQLNKRFLKHAGRNLKSKKTNKNFYHFDILGRVVLTGERFEMPHYKRAHYHHWFDIIWQDDCPGLAKSMAFSHSVKLSRNLIEQMIQSMFGLSRWLELESLYQKPFGFLTGDTLAIPVPMLNSTIHLGRNSSTAIRIANEKKHVSRQHASIRQTPDGPLLRDLGSSNGTWVNGRRLDADHSQLLTHDDVITLGRITDGKPSEQSVQFRYMTHLHTLPGLDLPEFEETLGMTAINDVPFDGDSSAT